jgi:glyoxylate reductase
MRIFATRSVPEQIRAMVPAPGLDLRTPTASAATAAELVQEGRRSDAVLVTIADVLDDAFFAAVGEGPLRVVSTISTGVDHVDLAAAARAGVRVMSLPGDVTGPATAELAWALTLAAARGILPAAADLRAGRWATWDPWQWTGVQLEGATMGIVGFGSIGSRVARYAAAFGMTVVCATRTVPAAQEAPSVEFVPLDRLCARADVISLHVPLTPQTARLVDADFLAQLRPGAVLINTCRGGVLDENAVLAALTSGQLRAVGLDVYTTEPVAPDSPLVTHPRVVALPHIGSATESTRSEMVRRALQAAVDALT